MDIDSLLNSVPTPTEAEMAERRKLARRYTLVFLRECPATSGDESFKQRVHLEHLQHLTKLQLLGKLVLNDPTRIEHDIHDVGMYEAEPEEAKALTEADPKVQAGFLTVEVIPWIAVPGESYSG